MALAFLFLICIVIPISHSFITPPLESRSAEGPKPTPKSQNASGTVWHRPEFGNRTFESHWYYWLSNPRQTSEHIPNGTVYWSFNGTQMYYNFKIPSLNIEYHQYVINETLYLWTIQSNVLPNSSDYAHCYSYQMPFHLIHDYFDNSSFVGLTNGPDIITNSVPPEVHSEVHSEVHPSLSLRSSLMNLNLLSLQNISNTTESPTHSPSDSPTNSPTNSPSQSPSHSPTDSPTTTEAPTHSPSDSPTQPPTRSPSDSPSRAPTDSPTNSPSPSPSHSPTVSPSHSPSSGPFPSPTGSPVLYPLTQPEALWTGFLWTEHVFGRNLSYIVSAKADGSIGALHISMDQRSIDLSVGTTTSTVMWLKNVTWDLLGTELPMLPMQCLNSPINDPSMAPTAAPTAPPTFSPVEAQPQAAGPQCSLPPYMVIVYVVLITFLMLLLFCWFAHKNSIFSRMIAGGPPYPNGYGQGAGGYNMMGQYDPRMEGGHGMRGGGRGRMEFGRYDQFPMRKESDQYVAEQSSDRDNE